MSYAGYSLGWGLTPLQRSNRCILQPQPIGQLEGKVHSERIDFNGLWLTLSYFSFGLCWPDFTCKLFIFYLRELRSYISHIKFCITLLHICNTYCIIHRPVGWGCRIRRQHLYRGVSPQSPNRATFWPWADTHKALGRDPGGWAVIDLATEWQWLAIHHFGLYLVWRSVGLARSDQSAGPVMPEHI